MGRLGRVRVIRAIVSMRAMGGIGAVRAIGTIEAVAPASCDTSKNPGKVKFVQESLSEVCPRVCCGDWKVLPAADPLPHPRHRRTPLPPPHWLDRLIA